MRRRHRLDIGTWLLLLVLAAAEFGGSHLPLPRGLRPLLLVPSVLMAATVALLFMRIRSSPGIARGFAIAGLFWLTILLGLGMMDPLTRAIYPVHLAGIQ
jgi:cytochrome c oxidase subunit 4